MSQLREGRGVTWLCTGSDLQLNAGEDGVGRLRVVMERGPTGLYACVAVHLDNGSVQILPVHNLECVELAPEGEAP